MTKAILNKTLTAIRVPLPHGKVLHLGPNQSGHVSAHDIDHAPLVALMEAGTIEIVDDDNEALPQPHHRPRAPYER